MECIESSNSIAISELIIVKRNLKLGKEVKSNLKHSIKHNSNSSKWGIIINLFGCRSQSLVSFDALSLTPIADIFKFDRSMMRQSPHPSSTTNWHITGFVYSITVPGANKTHSSLMCGWCF